MDDLRRPVLAVGDHRRPSIRRAVLGTLCAATTFCAFAAAKEVKPLFVHAPWLNDPYDTVESFTMFFVPLVAALLLVQVSLCQRSESLPVARVVAILRASRVIIGSIAAELLTAWLAVGLGANEARWTPGGTGPQIGMLVVATVVTVTVAVPLVRVTGPSRRTAQPDLSGSDDWLGDAVAVARRESRWFGSLRGRALSIIDWCDLRLIRWARCHPVTAAVVVSAGFGVAVFGWQGYREGYVPSATVLAMALGFCGMFAFLIPFGSYFGLVRSSNPSSGMRRRVLDASVIASAAAIVALAFHADLWGLIGTNSTAEGPAQFATLEGSVVALSFTVALIAESVARSHNRFAR